jgi:SAM-dependent methyltransferase
MIESYRAGGHDWLAVWRHMYDEEREQAERATLPGFEPRPDCWAGQAGRFAAAGRQAPQPDGFMRFLLPRLRPADRVLDIGAGAGRYEPSLAAAAREVVALEPSPAMREQLQRRLDEERLANVRLLPTGWPSAEPAECEVALAAHVLYGVREIEPFLRRMDAVATRGCYLLLAFRHPSSFISPFWERLYGQPRLPLPGALECLNALYQLGIAAQLTAVPVDQRFAYGSEEEALADLRWGLRAPHTPEYDQAIRAAIAELLVREPGGRLSPPGAAQQHAVIWWEKTMQHAK